MKHFLRFVLLLPVRYAILTITQTIKCHIFPGNREGASAFVDFYNSISYRPNRFLRNRLLLLFLCMLCICIALTGCSSSDSHDSDSGADASVQTAQADGTRDATAQVLVPQADGIVTYGSDIVSVDASHTSDGYVMLRYTGSNEKVKLQVTLPDGTEYTYPVTDSDTDSVYLLPGGSGSYKITLLESVSVENNLYAISFTQDLDVTIRDDFSPFLYPNFYVNFTQDSACVAKGEVLAEGCSSDLDVVTNIYNFVIKHITYDQEKADAVPYGYVPVPDDTLATGKGICFDYASLMSAMLRSQRIPTKLDVGYSGEVYHAWISCYVDEVGWVDGIIKFDGRHWSLMDPTLAASNSAANVKKYVGDGSNYTTKYTY